MQNGHCLTEKLNVEEKPGKELVAEYLHC
jgi:hypothetical protein